MRKTYYKRAAGIKYLGSLIKDTLKKFADDDPMSLCASISFYTMFSMPGLLLMLVLVSGAIFGEEAVTGELKHQISAWVGVKAAGTIEEIIQNARSSGSSTVATIFGAVTLLFSGTTVFISIQNALNRIWGVKPRPRRGFLKFLLDRALSLSMVLFLGVLLSMFLFVDTLLVIFNKELSNLLPNITWLFMFILKEIILLVTSIIVFGFIFKVLPDARIRWRDVWTGAIVTGILFFLGKWLVGMYLQLSSIGSAYGAAGSLVLLLIWVYYSAFVLLLGGEFTQVNSRKTGRRIYPARNAVKVIEKEILRGREAI